MHFIQCDGDGCLQSVWDQTPEKARKRAITDGWRPLGEEWFCPDCMNEIVVDLKEHGL